MIILISLHAFHWPTLLWFSPFSFLFKESVIEQLQKRIKLLENSYTPSVDSLLKKLEAYAIRKAADFDKYRAIALLEELVILSCQAGHDKAQFFKVALESLRENIDSYIFRFYLVIVLIIDNR